MADTDIITLEEAQAFVHSTAPANSAVLAMAVSAVSNRIDVLHGPVVQRVVTGEVTSRGPLGEVQLVHYPVVSVSSVVETVNGVDSTVAASAYSLDRAFGFLSRTAPASWSNHYGDRWTSWADTVTVSYIAGRYATTGDVPADTRFLCGEIVGEVVRQNAARWQRRSDAFDEDEEPGGYRSLDVLIRSRFPTRPARALSVPVVSL